MPLIAYRVHPRGSPAVSKVGKSQDVMSRFGPGFCMYLLCVGNGFESHVLRRVKRFCSPLGATAHVSGQKLLNLSGHLPSGGTSTTTPTSTRSSPGRRPTARPSARRRSFWRHRRARSRRSGSPYSMRSSSPSWRTIATPSCGERTLADFFERLVPFGAAFMALFGRKSLPHRRRSPCLAAVPLEDNLQSTIVTMWRRMVQVLEPATPRGHC
jgi:hypothetical protein